MGCHLLFITVGNSFRGPFSFIEHTYKHSRAGCRDDASTHKPTKRHFDPHCTVRLPGKPSAVTIYPCDTLTQEYVLFSWGSRLRLSHPPFSKGSLTSCPTFCEANVGVCHLGIPGGVHACWGCRLGHNGGPDNV